MTTVAACGGCRATVYRLPTAAGSVVVLDTAAHPPVRETATCGATYTGPNGGDA
jgi:hypothetical protein